MSIKMYEKRGHRWTEEEDNQLMESASNYMTIEQIAKNHQRTVGGIKIRIAKNAYEIMKKENKKMDEVLKIFHHIGKKDIIEHIKILQYNKSKKREVDNDEWSIEENNNLMEFASNYLTLEEIAMIHNRDIKSVKDRLLYNISNMVMKENKIIDDLCYIYYQVSEIEVLNYILDN